VKIPVSELPKVLDDDHNLAWAMALPEGAVDPRKLVVDMGQFGFATRMAGLGGVVVRGYQGETSQYSLNASSVSGINTDGSATGVGSVSVEKAETENIHLEDDNDIQLPETYRWRVATVDINRAEIASCIADRRRGGQTSEEAWASELNRSLSRGIRTAAFNNLLRTPAKKFYDASYATTYGGIAVGELIYSTPDHALSFLTISCALATIFQSTTNKVIYGEPLLRQKRWGVLPFTGIQPDRFALASMALAAKPLISSTER
jgi:hypothetical protein